MKKFSVLMFALAVIGTSCTREFVCQCRVSYKGQIPGLPDSTLTEFVIKDFKSAAETNCKANSSTVTTNGITVTESCNLY
jgi:hypothetical protein